MERNEAWSIFQWGFRGMIPKISEDVRFTKGRGCWDDSFYGAFHQWRYSKWMVYKVYKGKSYENGLAIMHHSIIPCVKRTSKNFWNILKLKKVRFT